MFQIGIVRIETPAKSKLYKKDLFTSEYVEYIIAKPITEYDMKEAGWNLILYYDLLPKNIVTRLARLSKGERTVAIGKLQGNDATFNMKLTKSFGMMRKKFFIANDIEDSDVLSIRKDAIFIISRVCPVTKFDNIEFKDKHVYSSFHKFGRLEMYYKSSSNKITMKGFGKDQEELDNLEKHDDYMLSILKDIFRELELGDKSNFIRDIKSFVYAYKHRQLDPGYYRELNSISSIVLNNDINISDYYTIGVEDVDAEFMNKIDISYNYINFIFPIIRRHYFIGIKA